MKNKLAFISMLFGALGALLVLEVSDELGAMRHPEPAAQAGAPERHADNDSLQSGDESSSAGGPAAGGAANGDTGKKKLTIAEEDEQFGVPGARWARYSPDGGQIAFSLHGDLWTMPAAGGRARRLTLHEANDIKPVWSPDGASIAFTSDRGGSFDVWIMSADGGAPRQLTSDGGFDHICCFLPGGEEILTQSTGAADWRIYRVPVAGGTPVQAARDTNAVHANWCPADGMIYYQSSISDGRKGYRGTCNDELFRCKPGDMPQQLTDNSQNDRQPYPSPDGKSLYFLRETGETGKDFNLFVRDLAMGDVAPAAERQLTNLDEGGINYLSFSDDFSKAVFCWKFRLYAIELAHPDAPPALLPVRIVEDTRQEKTVNRRYTDGAEDADMSSDGKLIAFSVGGSIWLMPASGGEAKRMTPLGSGDRMPRFSPDGKRLAFFSEARTGNSDIFVMALDGSAIRQVTTSPKGDFFHNWAPDGSYLVYCSEAKGNRDIWKVGLDGSPPVALTDTPKSDDDPSVSPDGRWIAFDSDRDGRNAIYVMKADGTGVRRVYGSAEHEESPRFSPNGTLLVFARMSRGALDKRSVVVTDLAGSGEIVIGEGHDASFTPDGHEILYVDQEGRIRAAPAPTNITGGRAIPFIAADTVKQNEQFKRAFEEAWNYVERDFYDEKHHGVDWKAMKERYAPLVERAATRMEFYFYMNQMVDELNASHQGVSGPITDAKGYVTGFIAAEFTPEPMEEAAEDAKKRKGAAPMRLRVGEVEEEGPADKAWIREGDYIFGAGAKPRLTVSDNFYEQFKDTPGKEVSLWVGTKPDASDLREVKIKPEDPGATRARRYSTWVKSNRETVAKESDNAVAYVHLPKMKQDVLQRFQEELGSKKVQAAKALIMDIRGNTGGNIHQQLIDILARRHYAETFGRGIKNQPSPSLYWDRPVVLLIDEKSFSDAEVFPHAFKTLGLGTIVGVRTHGSVIGTQDLKLVDGSTFRNTRTGYRNLDDTLQENNGCPPDIEVRMTIEDRILKRDPQLAKAVAVALEKIAAAPARGEASPDTPAEEPEAPREPETPKEPETPHRDGEDLPRVSDPNELR